MQKTLIIIAGFLISFSSVNAQTTGTQNAPAGENAAEPEVLVVVSVPSPCAKADACYEKITPPWTERWCPAGPGKFDVFLIFGNTPVSEASQECRKNLPGICSRHCND